MSALLLDTHVWLWYAEGVADRLRPASVRKLEEARRGDGLLVSAISVWEIGMHAARGRIQLTVPLRDWVERALAAPGIRLARLDAAVAAESALLPGEPQGDPADRFLIATARTHGVALATRDEGILAYAKQGFLRAVRICLRCSRAILYAHVTYSSGATWRQGPVCPGRGWCVGPRLGRSRVGGLYSMLMGNKTNKDIPGIAFLVDSRGRRKSVLIDLEQHGSLWEDLYDAYVAQQRRTEPRESLATVKRLIQSSARRRGRG